MRGGFALSDLGGRYTIEEELGSGAFGTVYAARDAHSGERVALKHLSRMSAQALSRFKREFRAVQGLNHPHIVRLDALFEHPNGWLIAMEYVRGRELIHYLERSEHKPPFDEQRLRSAFRQLAEALAALHQHGILHRDLKPANVRVTPDGRVVLLDFGLVTDLAEDAQSTHHGGAGTAAYMAPEQAVDRVALTEAADWYAFGTCLYRALTGSVPFRASSSFAMILAKQRESPEPPSARLGHALPQDLEQLCLRLLAVSPEHRPGIEDVRRLLESVEAQATAPHLTSGAHEIQSAELDLGEAFQGREAELEQIWRAHEKAGIEGLRMLLVEGESGMGKSTLVSEWIQQLRQREPQVLVLKSQCYENEHSAFKAFDEGMDALARRLRRIQTNGDGFSVPTNAGLLPRLFPALGSVDALQRAPLDEVPADPSAALRSALIALVEMLGALSESSPVVLAIDDLQWADPESFRLLRTIGASNPRVLVLATLRPGNELTEEIAGELEQLRTRLCLERLPLEGLSPLACKRLARSLLRGNVLPEWLERITAESKGHPLFLSVLSRYAVNRRLSHSDELSLEQALASRLLEIDAESRALLEVLALAAVPCSLSLLSRALRTDVEELHMRAAQLVSAKLVRRLPEQRFSCFHDRLRGVIAMRLAPSRERQLHRDLANAVAQGSEYDPALLAQHLEGAGQWQQALEAHREAGRGALSAFAFGKAEYHYSRALALCEKAEVESGMVTDLRVQRGHALARSGKSALAAAQYTQAAQHAEGSQRIALRVGAAQHLLQGAQLEAGLREAADVLAELEQPMPRSESGALARLAWDRFCVRVRGLSLSDERPPIEADERVRLDAMGSLAVPVFYVDPLMGASINARHLRRSLAAKDPLHVARALAADGCLLVMRSPEARPQGRMLIEKARALYNPDEEPAFEAWTLFCQGAADNLCTLPAEARHSLSRAEWLLTTRCPDEPWLLTIVRFNLGGTWFQLGQLGAHVAKVEHWLAEAAERDDLFARAFLESIGFGAMRFVLRDETECVRAHLEQAVAPWSRGGFGMLQLGALLVNQLAAQYVGGAAAWKQLQSAHQNHRQPFLLRVGFGRAVYHVLWAQAALAAAASNETAATNAYLVAARKHARALRRSKVGWAQVHASLIASQLAAFGGDTERALELIEQASREVARRECGLLVPSVTYFHGLLQGGEAGSEKRKQALDLAATQHWRNPRRCVAMNCPIIDWLEAKA